MNGPGYIRVLAVLCCSLSLAAHGDDYDARWSGNLSLRAQGHNPDAGLPGQPDTQSAFIGEVEYELQTPGGDLVTIKPYLRSELHDGGDDFPDLREALYLTFGEDWELRTGVGKVFWGVTESVHLVDVINQTDVQEDTDGEEKLGQPMLQATLLRDWGTLSVFVLPYFRERELPQRTDRPSLGITVDNDAAQFESDDREQHVDGALRYTHTLDEIDLGLSYFDGTSREPRLGPNADGDRLIPFYPLMRQAGLDLQYTTEGWLWKLEAIYREDDIEEFSAAAGGFEYTFVGVFDTAQDVGLVVEYLYDERGDEASTPFANDMLIGLRWVLNDVQSTEALLGVIGDLDGGGQAISLEASRRLGESYRLNLDARGFANTDGDPQLDAFRDEYFVRLELGYYF